MVGLSKLCLGPVEPSDALRYRRDSRTLSSESLQFSADKKPEAVWNLTQRCNLRCRQRYAATGDPCAADSACYLTSQEIADA